MTISKHRPMRGFLLVAVGSLVAAMAGCGGGGGGGGVPAPVAQQNSVVVGDFNGDGRLDLAVTTAFVSGQSVLPGQVEIFRQNPVRPGFFALQEVVTVGNDPSQLASGDLNRDGLPDLVAANENSDSVSVLLNDPLRPGNFFPAVDYPTGPAPLGAAVGDLNRDGLPDIAVAVADGVDILFQNPTAPGTFLSPAHLALAGGAFGVAVGDLDGDGITDIAATGTSAVQVFFQNPLTPGAFSLPTPFAAGLQPNGIAIADIDRDGLLDMAVANIGLSPGGSGASFSILRQDPLLAGNFLPARNFTTPNGARNLAVGDLDGDGFPDVVVASVVFQSVNPGLVSVFLQIPAAPGNFQLASTHPNGFTPQAVAIGDLDADGRPDIAIQDGPSILFQDPLRPGTFFDEVLIGP